jgi:hypothetical protein
VSYATSLTFNALLILATQMNFARSLKCPAPDVPSSLVSQDRNVRSHVTLKPLDVLITLVVKEKLAG